MTLGCSLGAFHAANFALKRADLFPLAMCLSGTYDPAAWNGWGERGTAAYFNNPLDYVRHLHGDHLDWLREHVSLLLVCGQGQWEDTTGVAGRAPGSSPRCWPRSRSATNSTCGVMTCRMTGHPGAPRSHITCRDSAEDGSRQ